MTHFKLFPRHFNIILSEQERGALEDLYERDETLVDELELVHKVLVEGIKSIVGAAGKDDTSPAFAANAAVAGSSPKVENYVGFPIRKRLRDKLEAFLDSFPDAIREEEALAMLLDLGLDHASDSSGR